MRLLPYLLPIIILAVPLPARAIPAITCHCFTDRSFNPEKPAAADTYFLATTQNSLMSLVFGIDKKTIVIQKQQGAAGDDLWVACRLAGRSGRSPESLLEERQARGSWPAVVASLRLPVKGGGSRFDAALKARAATPRLSEAVLDDIFLQYRLAGETELAALRQAGASNQELILATLLAARSGKPARQLLGEIKKGGRSWGTLLHENRLDAQSLPQAVAALLRLPG